MPSRPNHGFGLTDLRRYQSRVLASSLNILNENLVGMVLPSCLTKAVSILPI